MSGTVDPPGAFAPVEEWESYVAQLEELAKGDEEYELALRDAREFLEMRRSAPAEEFDLADFADLADEED